MVAQGLGRRYVLSRRWARRLYFAFQFSHAVCYPRAMAIDPQQWAQFKAEVHQAKDSDRKAWESSRKLVGHSSIAQTLNRLVQAIQASDQPSALKALLMQ